MRSVIDRCNTWALVLDLSSPAPGAAQQFGFLGLVAVMAALGWSRLRG